MWESAGAISPTNTQVEDVKTFDSIVDSMAENPVVGFNDFYFPIASADIWLEDPKFAEVREVFANTVSRDVDEPNQRGWTAHLFQGRCGKIDPLDPLVIDPYCYRSVIV